MSTALFTAASALITTGAAHAANSEPVRGYWSAAASSLGLTDPAGFHRDWSIASPNGLFRLRVIDTTLSVSGSTALSQKRLAVGIPAEALWAPDSGAFAITSSDGGAVGTWSAAVYRLRDGLITNPTKIALAAFARDYPNCPDEHPNAGVAGWSNDSRNIRLVVEMPCHGPCVDMCRFKGYVVDAASGKIVNRLSEHEVRNRWGFGRAVTDK